MPVWILIQEAPEYGSNTNPDPQHWLKAFFFKGAGAGAGEKILGSGAGQKWTGSATLLY